MNKREYITKEYFIEKIGHGKPLYIIGGGPGLDYSYLYKWLVPLSELSELIFYNQYGIYENNQTSFDKLVEQLYVILKANQEKKDVIAHSFGSHLLFTVLSKYHDLKIDKIIMINPCPITYENYIKSGERLYSRISDEDKKKINLLESRNDRETNSMIMSLLLPYYLYQNVKVDFCIYNNKMCQRIEKQLEKFDFTNFIINFKNDMLLIKGDYDFINISDTINLQLKAKKTLLYDKCGHFAFAEKNEDVLKEIRLFLER